MKSFVLKVLRNVAALMLAYMIFCLLAFVILLGILGAVGSGKPATVPESAVLVIDMSMSVPDSPRAMHPLEAIGESLDSDSQPVVHLRRALQAIDYAAGDDRIKAILLHASSVSGSMNASLPNMSELRAAVERFKAAGKPVYAYLENAAQRDYYLASAADEVYMHPLCLLTLHGVSYERAYFGDAFETYGVGTQTAVAGRYKSAVDTFTRSDMSEQDEAQGAALIDDAWTVLATGIAGGRKQDVASITGISRTHGLISAEEALQLGLVDAVIYKDQLLAKLMALVGETRDGDTFEQVAFDDYASLYPEGLLEQSADKVAIVYVDGVIVDGEGRWDEAGAARISRELRKLRNDDDVKAVVIRINSPGGSATAAEVIRREVELLGAEVPVVVSMGGMAASGGYWIAAPAKRIFADPVTLTGSIGVFMFLPNIEKLAAGWGVTFDQVQTSPFADMFSISRPRGQEEMARLQAMVEQIYGTFLDNVARGREMPLGQVREVAEGRVWTGLDAMEVGLVDELTGIEGAIASAASLAGIKEYSIREIPASRGIETLIQLFDSGASSSSSIEREMKAAAAELRTFTAPQHLYARLPFRLRVNW